MNTDRKTAKTPKTEKQRKTTVLILKAEINDIKNSFISAKIDKMQLNSKGQII